MAFYEVPEGTPANISPYVRALGVDGAIDFFLKFGGAPIHLTERPNSGSSVVAAIGLESAQALGRQFGPGYQKVPTSKPWIAQRLHAQGESVLAIARKIHMTAASVRGYVRPKVEQLTMFDEPDPTSGQ